MQDEIVKRYRNAFVSDTVIQIVTPEDYKISNVTQKNPKNKWHYKAEYVSDFSFAASNHCRWDGVSVVVDGSA